MKTRQRSAKVSARPLATASSSARNEIAMSYFPVSAAMQLESTGIRCTVMQRNGSLGGNARVPVSQVVWGDFSSPEFKELELPASDSGEFLGECFVASCPIR